ncbi:MAG: lysophospholipid acyltransferase family protein [Candidatus Aminicenantes bacterium]|nr:lysophospholipid acyltransferase family protein [Candidatus Aminicenantes bacterium]
MPFKKQAVLWLIKYPGKILIGLWMKLCRWRIEGDESYRALRKAGRPVVLLIWHGKIFVVPYFFRKRSIAALVSPSGDGELVARLMDGWGYRLIRGSGSHPMKTAWVEMVKVLQTGGEVIIVPDGPKGPDRRFKLGAVKLATETGAALVPFSFTAKRRKILRSWDRFEMFFPFTEIAAVYGEPVEIPPNLAPERWEEERLRAENIMLEFEAGVEKRFVRPE